MRDSDVEFPELKTTSFLLLFVGKFISSIALLKKTCPQLAPYVLKSMRSKGTRKYRQRTFLIFRQFPGLGKVDQKRLIDILRSKPAMLRENALECGYPHAITKKRRFLPLIMSAVLINYLHNKGCLPQKPEMPCFSLCL